MRRIPQRELRNDIARVLREVEGGERLQVTVSGRPVAEIIPVAGTRRTFVPRQQLLRILETSPLDAGFLGDIEAASGGTLDEL